MADYAGLSPSSGVNTEDLTYHAKNKKGDLASPRNSDTANEWYYKKQEAELNYRYSLDAWNRQNEYNDPSAVADRYRSAGINPRSALSGAASGAGVASTPSSPSVSGSYGKSDQTQNIENASTLTNTIGGILQQSIGAAQGVSSIINQSASTSYVGAQTEGVQIANRYKETQILTDLEKQRAEILKTLEDTSLSKSQRAVNEKNLNWLDQQISESQQRITESGARIEGTQQQIRESQARTKKVVEETDLVRAEQKYKKAVTEMVADERKNKQMDTALKEAQKGHYEKLKSQIEKEIEYLGVKMRMSEQQIKVWKNQIAQAWVKTGGELAQATSQEIRNWMFGFIPGVKQQSTTFSDAYGDSGSYMFAD